MNFPRPNYPQSSLIQSVEFEKFRIHKGNGDMWLWTWADDDELYAASGDIPGSVLNFWKITNKPHFATLSVEMVNYTPIDREFANALPDTHPWNNLKPAGVICLDGQLYMTVSSMNYGEEAHYYRQRYPNSWIVTSDDYGVTWDIYATPYTFFSGGFRGATFVQFGKNYSGARDNFVYAVSPCSQNGESYWENADGLIMGRVLKEKILEIEAWEYRSGDMWVADVKKATPIFNYPNMTGQNLIQYNAGIKRYILGNYSFMTKEGTPCPYHAGEFLNLETKYPSQLSLYEAPEPWGPWSLFHLDDNWGMYGGYQPSFPTKWMSVDGLEMYMVSSGSYDDYNFTVQKLKLSL